MSLGQDLEATANLQEAEIRAQEAQEMTETEIAVIETKIESAREIVAAAPNPANDHTVATTVNPRANPQNARIVAVTANQRVRLIPALALTHVKMVMMIRGINLFKKLI